MEFNDFVWECWARWNSNDGRMRIELFYDADAQERWYEMSLSAGMECDW